MVNVIVRHAKKEKEQTASPQKARNAVSLTKSLSDKGCTALFNICSAALKYDQLGAKCRGVTV